MTSDNRILKKLSSIRPLRLAVQMSLICGLAVSGVNAAFAGALEREEAKRIHDHLAGIPPTENMLCAMEWLIGNGTSNGPEEAAYLVMSLDPATDPNIPNVDFTGAQSACGGSIDNHLSKKAFYSTSLKNFVTPWTNEDQTVHADLNDYTALVIGMIRDDMAFDTVLSTDKLYTGTDPSLPQVSVSNNDHFKAMQDRDLDLSDPNVLSGTAMNQVDYFASSPNTQGAEPAGVTTTRAASLAFFTGGTNRLMWRMTAVNYLCHDMEQLKDVSRPTDRIRQDVSRSPGGDSSVFLSSCMGCHAGMDPLVGAYAYYDHEITGDQTVTPDGEPRTSMLWKYNSTMFGGGSAEVTQPSLGETLFNANCLGSGCHTASELSAKPHTPTDILNAIDNQSRMSNVSRNLDFNAIATYLDDPTAQTSVKVDVTAKYLINSANFKYGYVTKDDEWTNYWRQGPNADLDWGWRESYSLPTGPRSVSENTPDGPKTFTVPGEGKIISTGYGAASLGLEVTSTKAFAQCQVEKVYKFVCLHDPNSIDTATASALNTIVNNMPSDDYHMKTVFAKVAPLCMGN